MKMAELLKKIEAGEAWVTAEWRSGEAKLASGTDDRGKAYARPQFLHNVEIGGKAVTLKEKLVENTRIEGYVPRFRKGQTIAIQLGIDEADRGAFYLRCVFDSVEKA